MAFWATTWAKTASTAAAEEQLARLQDGVVRLETSISSIESGGSGTVEKKAYPTV